MDLNYIWVDHLVATVANCLFNLEQANKKDQIQEFFQNCKKVSKMCRFDTFLRFFVQKRLM